jgi:predicted esterase
MQTTQELLSKALAVAPVPVWTKKLNLSVNALHVAQHHGRLSPVIAGGLAIELNEDPAHWMAIAAIENAKPSKSRDQLLKKIQAMRTW